MHLNSGGGGGSGSTSGAGGIGGGVPVEIKREPEDSTIAAPSSSVVHQSCIGRRLYSSTSCVQRSPAKVVDI